MQTLANPPGSYICMTHRAASVLHTSEPTQNTFFNSAARSMQNVLTVAICHGKSVQWRSTRCNKWKQVLTHRETFLATIVREKLPGSKQQHSHRGSTTEIFSGLFVRLLWQHSPTRHPLVAPAQLEAAASRRKGQNRGSRLQLTCVALAEDGHGLSAHAMHGERVVLWHLRRRILLPRGARGGQLLAEAEPYLRNAAEGQGRGNISDVTALGRDIYWTPLFIVVVVVVQPSRMVEMLIVMANIRRRRQPVLLYAHVPHPKYWDNVPFLMLDTTVQLPPGPKNMLPLNKCLFMHGSDHQGAAAHK